MAGKVYIGCCGFPVRRDLYYKTFQVVEIQQTFYQLPELKTAIRWRNEAPRDFEFTIKAPQLITHEPTSPTYRRYRKPLGNKDHYGSFKPTHEVFEAWKETAEFAKVLKARIILFQTPASFKPLPESIENIRTFFSSIDRDEFILLWEPRGPWKEETIKELCRDLNLVHCVDPFKALSLHGRLKYYRLHGKSGYKYRYTEEDLKWLSTLVGKETAYFMFNNVNMFEDARRFKGLLRL